MDEFSGPLNEGTGAAELGGGVSMSDQDRYRASDSIVADGIVRLREENDAAEAANARRKAEMYAEPVVEEIIEDPVLEIAGPPPRVSPLETRDDGSSFGLPMDANLDWKGPQAQQLAQLYGAANAQPDAAPLYNQFAAQNFGPGAANMPVAPPPSPGPSAPAVPPPVMAGPSGPTDMSDPLVQQLVQHYGNLQADPGYAPIYNAFAAQNFGPGAANAGATPPPFEAPVTPDQSVAPSGPRNRRGVPAPAATPPPAQSGMAAPVEGAMALGPASSPAPASPSPSPLHAPFPPDDQLPVSAFGNEYLRGDAAMDQQEFILADQTPGYAVPGSAGPTRVRFTPEEGNPHAFGSIYAQGQADNSPAGVLARERLEEDIAIQEALGRGDLAEAEKLMAPVAARNEAEAQAAGVAQKQNFEREMLARKQEGNLILARAQKGEINQGTPSGDLLRGAEFFGGDLGRPLVSQLTALSLKETAGQPLTAEEIAFKADAAKKLSEYASRASVLGGMFFDRATSGAAGQPSPAPVNEPAMTVQDKVARLEQLKAKLDAEGAVTQAEKDEVKVLINELRG